MEKKNQKNQGRIQLICWRYKVKVRGVKLTNLTLWPLLGAHPRVRVSCLLLLLLLLLQLQLQCEQ